MTGNPMDCRKKTILVVDDEHDILAMVQRMLEREGYTVWTSDNAEKAILMADVHKAHLNLLLTDVQMPGMNGIEMSAVILSENPALLCIYMSGHIPESIAPMGALKEGVNFIRKPFGVGALTEMVNHALVTPGLPPPPPPQ
ncbi:response regulator (plasmid) [Chlorobium phaeovibrioides]|uniref:Response regulator n=2 Tax=Chlorobium phaeovibrioides TaxID=1094 RepID=A0A5M8I8G0_CHLPH|nr:response regulator [Chlorobium phaeovibrioides]